LYPCDLNNLPRPKAGGGFIIFEEGWVEIRPGKAGFFRNSYNNLGVRLIDPFGIQFDVCFVHPPASVNRLLALADTLVNKANKALDPSLQGCMVNLGTPDHHHFFQIPVTQGKPALHVYKQHNY
jgi:hypothetical protein